MIHDVDASLMALLRRDALDGSDVEVVLDAPNREWAARRSAPTVNLYLYDIREALAHRQEGRVFERDDDGRVVAHRPPARQFRLAYLVTAWTQRPEDEHRLLSTVLGCLLAHDTMPAAVLSGSLVGSPVAVSVGRPPSDDRPVSDVWSALGGELKPSLDLVVTAPMTAGVVTPAAPLVREPLHLRATDGTAQEERRGRTPSVPVPATVGAGAVEAPTPRTSRTPRAPRQRRRPAK